MKRLFTGMAAALLAAVLFFPCTVHGISAEKCILLDAATGRVIHEKNADKPGLIASTTKIMTALVVCEQCNVLDRVRVPKEAVGIEGSSMYLKEGEILTIQELLYGLMLQSGNDAAVALAIYCGGTVEGFAELMNDKARQLGMEDTHFVNPNGLDAPDNYSTARDMATLAVYAMQNPIFAQTVSTKQVSIGARSLRNHNKLLWQVEGADGVKTGYTKAAGRILVSSVIRDGRRLVAVTMNAPSDWEDHRQLLESGFLEYTMTEVVKEGTVVGHAEIAGGESGAVELIARQNFTYPLSVSERAEILVRGPGFVYAPVAEGQAAGVAYVMIGDSVVGKISLCYGANVEMKSPTERPSLLRRIFGGG